MDCYISVDHTRVILQTLPGRPKSDYINGNFIDVSFSLVVLQLILTKYDRKWKWSDNFSDIWSKNNLTSCY